MTIYLSGPITNNPDFLEDFDYAEEVVNQIYPDAKIINPSRLSGVLKNGDYEEYMKISFSLMDLADVVYMVPGWENSKGAMREKAEAIKRGLKVIGL